ncbi:hypothetical protein [Streptomyces blattellae]|uniref:hypothetical protein n=1 Tax=Streptomyces blattellae TaxID=2569855 RepID=UPI0012B6F885|nr:hypothetical protein [Streptomyces blattellae]
MNDGVLLALECGFLLMLLVGVALIYVPAAFILAGVLGVVVVERAMAQKRAVEGRRGGEGGER